MRRAGTIALVAGSVLASSAAQATAAPFEKKESLQGITFQVTSPNQQAANTVLIVPAGLQLDNAPIEMEVPGIVTGAEVADINADRSPEIYIYVLEPGPEKRMSLLAFSANKKKSLSMIYLPALNETPGADKGYCGNDDMAPVEGVFMRRFPLCGTGQQPTGKTRQLEYKLRPGEAGWQLKLDKMVDN